MLASRPAETQSILPHEQLIGKYTSDLYGEIFINIEDGKLVHRYGETDLFTADLELWQGLTYIIQYRNKINPPEFLTFIPNQTGGVASLEVKDVDVFHRK
jgi:hypothetical protein